MRKISTTARHMGGAAKLQKPAANNLTCVNIWSPGYREPIIDASGKVTISSKFIETNNYGIALKIFSNFFNNTREDFNTFLQHVSPGHVSLGAITTQDNQDNVAFAQASKPDTLKKEMYLSIGSYGSREIKNVLSPHKIFFVDDFQTDVLAMERFPRHCLDLYTLDNQKIYEFITNLKTDPGYKYMLLGRFKSGTPEEIVDSCVTSVHATLLHGGLNQLLSMLDRLSQEHAMTPLMQTHLIESARAKEIKKHSTEIANLREDFSNSMNGMRARFLPHLENNMQIFKPK